MKINNSYILLKDICCFAYHGVAPQENIIGNEYIINLKLKVDISQAIQTDDVVDTVNYAEIHEAVKAEMSIPSKLLEHVCGRIAKRLLAEFPAIEEIELRLSKRNPPMGASGQLIYNTLSFRLCQVMGTVMPKECHGCDKGVAQL